MDDVLGAVGLAPADQAVCESLIESAGTVAELAERTGLAGTELAAVLERLEEAGLAGRQAGRPLRYAAAAPDVALEALLLRQEERLQRARLRAQQLAAGYRKAVSGQDPATLVEVVTGRVAARQRFEPRQPSPRRAVRAIRKPPDA